MAIEYMNAVWKIDLEPSLKFILVTLADCADHIGQCFPSINYLSKRTGYSKSTILRALEDLEELKIIIKEKQVRKNKSNTSNKYTISTTIFAMADPPPPSVTMTPPSVTMTPPWCHHDTPYNHQIDPFKDPKEKNIKKISKVKNEQVFKIFEFWKKTLNHPKAILDNKRKKKIEEALKKRSEEDLIDAIKGCASSPFHMGDNPNGTLFDDIELILRDSKHIEMFMKILNNDGGSATQKIKQQKEDERIQAIINADNHARKRTNATH